MGTKVNIKHKESGLMKVGGYGFCWAYFFFGFFMPLFRGGLGVDALHLLFTCVTFGVWRLIACFIYNKQYMTRMLTSGWELAGTEEENRVAKSALGIED
jgi:hypothetical protein